MKEDTQMFCFIYKTCTTKPESTTVTLERDSTVVVTKNVPTQVCNNCEEYYLSEAVSSRIYDLAEKAVKRKVEVEVLHYVA